MRTRGGRAVAEQLPSAGEQGNFVRRIRERVQTRADTAYRVTRILHATCLLERSRAIEGRAEELQRISSGRGIRDTRIELTQRRFEIALGAVQSPEIIGRACRNVRAVSSARARHCRLKLYPGWRALARQQQRLSLRR